MTLGWLFARIALPFPLSGGILMVLPIVVGAQLPRAYQGPAAFTAAAGITLGIAAMVGLLLARRPRMQKLTYWSAGIAATFLVVAYVIAADPFCWRGYEADGTCAWE